MGVESTLRLSPASLSRLLHSLAATIALDLRHPSRLTAAVRACASLAAVAEKQAACEHTMEWDRRSSEIRCLICPKCEKTGFAA